MQWIYALSWRGSAFMVFCMVFTLGLKDVTSQSLECYSCTDRGEGGCRPENAVNVSCSSEHDNCLEAVIGIRTSHNTHIVLKKGCGSDVPGTLDKTISFHGIFIFLRKNECNSSLCNSNMDLKYYDLAADDTTTRVPNDAQCYSCIGKTNEECSPSSGPAMTCYNDYSNCFDGNVAISVDNDTTSTNVKSCSQNYRCAVHTETFGVLSIKVKGACCSGDLCNQDLSNKTQLGQIPSLVLLDDNKEVVLTTPIAAPWVTPTQRMATTMRLLRDEEAQPSLNSTASSPSSFHFQDGFTNNMAYGLIYAPWLISLLNSIL